MKIVVWLVAAACSLAAGSGASSAAERSANAQPSQKPAAFDAEGNLDIPVEGVVTNPDWVQLPTGEEMTRFYPRLGTFLAIDGVVRMACSVNSLGMLENCKIASELPAGIGFGPAALQMASYFRMRPRTINGAPVSGGSVMIPIRFKMYDDPPVADADQTDGPPPSPAAMASARRLATLLLAGDAEKDREERQLKQMQQMVDGAEGAGSYDQAQATKAFLAWRTSYVEGLPAWTEIVAQRYARIYSEAELTQIVAFFASPAGEAWRTKQASMEEGLVGQNRRWLTTVQKDAQKRFCDQTACPDAPAAAKAVTAK